MKLQHLIEIEQQKPLEKDDVLKMSQRKNLRYLYYDDIKSSDTLKKLLPEPDSGLLILFVTHNQNSEVGHFCLFFRNKRSGMHFFDSYGFGLKRVLDITGSSNKNKRGEAQARASLAADRPKARNAPSGT